MNDKLLKKFHADYQPKYFNSSEIENFLKMNENKLVLVLKIDENQSLYEKFNSAYSTSLSKLPNSILKDAVGSLFNKNLVFLGIAKNVDGTIYSRALISKNEKLAGVVLNSHSLDISLKDGNTPSINECIYATYFALVRASMIIHKQEVRKDFNLQKDVVGFLYNIMMKVIGRTISVGSNQKSFLHLMCAYLFYRQYLEEKHLKAVKIIYKHYSDIIGKENLDEFEDKIEKFSPFESFKDFPKMCQVFNICELNPSQVTMQLIRFLDGDGFHILIGSLDNLVAAITLAKYPTEIVSRGFSSPQEVHERMEKKVKYYIDKISYETEFANIKISK